MSVEHPLVVGGFFLIGLGDGSISSLNAGIWAMLLAVTITSLWGARAVRVGAHRHKR